MASSASCGHLGTARRAARRRRVAVLAVPRTPASASQRIVNRMAAETSVAAASPFGRAPPGTRPLSTLRPPCRIAGLKAKLNTNAKFYATHHVRPLVGRPSKVSSYRARYGLIAALQRWTEAGALRQRAHRLHQPVDVDWLGEVLLEPGGERAPPILVARERGQRDGRHLSIARRAELPQVADEAITVLARHRDVADDQLRVELRHRASRLLRRRDRADLRPRLPQHLLRRLAGRWIVVDDEDAQSVQPRGVVGRAPAFGRSRRASDGRLIPDVHEG